MSDPLKLALLGADDLVMSFCRRAIGDGAHIVWASDLKPAHQQNILELSHGVTIDANWETALAPGLADAVVVGHDSADPDETIERLKRLVIDGIPTVATFPVSTAVLPHYELEMLRQDAGGLLWMLAPAPPAVINQLSEWLREGHPEIGTVRQTSWIRHLDDSSKSAVLFEFARDVCFLSELLGGIHSVTALGPEADAVDFASLQVQLLGSDDLAVSWSTSPAQHDCDVTIVLAGERGRRDIQVSSAPLDPALQPEQLAAALRSPINADSTPWDWQHATRVMEIVDVAELSLQRARTIDVHHQQLTEQLAFKGVMSAMGCGLLLLGLLVLVAAGLAGDTVGVPLMGLWPFGLLGLFVVFLLLQLVPATARKRQGATSPENSAHETSRSE